MDKSVLELIKSQAVKMLKATGGVQSALFVEGAKENQKAMVLGIRFANRQQKYDIFLDIGRQFAYMEPTSVTYVDLAWKSNDKPPPGKRVSEMPDKQECIVVSHERRSPDSYKMMAITPFTRIGKDIALGESEEFSTEDDGIKLEGNMFVPFWLGVSKTYLEPKNIQAN